MVSIPIRSRFLHVMHLGLSQSVLVVDVVTLIES